jgi:hypothetical protein
MWHNHVIDIYMMYCNVIFSIDIYRSIEEKFVDVKNIPKMTPYLKAIFSYLPN